MRNSRQVTSEDRLLAIFIRQLRRIEKTQPPLGKTPPTNIEELLPHMRLVIRHALRRSAIVAAHGLTIMDLIQEGYFGLIAVFNKFDPRRGYQFSTYANWWIMARMNRALDQAHKKGVRIPGGEKEKLRNLDHIKRRLTAHFGRAPDTEEVLKECETQLHLTRPQAERLLMFQDMYAVAIDAPVNDEEGVTLEQLIPASDGTPENNCASQEVAERIRQGLEQLDPKLSQIIVRRFGLDGQPEESLAEIGIRLELSRERIRQLEQQAFRALATTLQPLSVQVRKPEAMSKPRKRARKPAASQ